MTEKDLFLELLLELEKQDKLNREILLKLTANKELIKSKQDESEPEIKNRIEKIIQTNKKITDILEYPNEFYIVT